MPHAADAAQLRGPAESSPERVDDEPPLVELPLVDSGALVTGGPDENRGGAVSPHAARTRCGEETSPRPLSPWRTAATASPATVQRGETSRTLRAAPRAHGARRGGADVDVRLR